MKANKHNCTILWIATLIWCGTVFHAAAQGSAFTYQGRLAAGGNPAGGIYDLRFAIYDLDSGGIVVAGPLTNATVNVSNGLFNVLLDFGADVFDGSARWLEIGVRTNGGGEFTALLPRQPITPIPYAIRAASAGSAIIATTAATAANVAAGAVGTSGLQAGAVDASRIAVGGIATSNLSLTVLSNTFWRLGGNAGTSPGANFLGTADNQPLELRVNNLRALRIEPNLLGAPNLIGGAPANYAAPGTEGATIAGGGATNYGGAQFTNSVSGDFSTVGGGMQNVISSDTFAGTVGGGGYNTLGIDTDYSTLGGGMLNTVSGQFATIPGGRQNAATNYAFAAGRRAKAGNTGSFVWADSTDADFASSSNNQFLIRASGGVGIGTNNPQSALHVAGTVTAGSFVGSGAGLTGISSTALAPGAVSNAALASAAVTAEKIAAAQVVKSLNGLKDDVTLVAGTNVTLATNGNELQIAVGALVGPLAGDVTGTQGATVVSTVGGQTASNVAGGVNAANAATSDNTPNTIVKRDEAGNFSAGSITVASITGNGAGLTNVQGCVTWQMAIGTNIITAPGTGYICTNRVQASLVLPVAPIFGDVIRVVAAGDESAGWRLVLNAGQSIPSRFLFARQRAVWTPCNLEGVTVMAASADLSTIAAFVGRSLHVSRDFGSNWVYQSDYDEPPKCAAMTSDGNKLFTHPSAEAIACSADGSLLAAASGTVRLSTNGGTNWSTCALPNLYWCSVAMSADGTKLIAAYNNLPVPPLPDTEIGTGPFYVSNDSGVTWFSSLVTPEGEWTGVACASNGLTMYAVGHYATTWLLRDGKITPEQRDIGKADHLSCVACSGDGSTFVMGNANLDHWQVSGPIMVSTNCTSNDFHAVDPIGLWKTIVVAGDGSRVAALDISHPGRIVISDIAGYHTYGAIVGSGGSAIELIYVGSGQFEILSENGEIAVQDSYTW